jgi:hypothetical protein
MVRRRPIVATCILFILLFITSEVYLRYAGFASYPNYDIDAQIKYIPAANQHGSFLNRNAWFFNDRHVITHPQIWSADFGCFTPRC